MDDYSGGVIRLVNLQIRLQAVHPLHIPPFPGSALRGLLQSSVCDYAPQLPWPWGEENPEKTQAALEIMKLSANASRPFSLALHDWGTEKFLSPGEGYAFDLILWGAAVAWWRALCRALELRGKESCEGGIFGGNYRLTEVLDCYDNRSLNWLGVEAAPNIMEYDEILAQAEEMSRYDRFELEIITPMQIQPLGRAASHPTSPTRFCVTTVKLYCCGLPSLRRYQIVPPSSPTIISKSPSLSISHKLRPLT